MVHVKVESSNIELEVNEGETLFAAAWRAGYYWPTSCNGGGSCLICWTRIEDGDELLSPPGEWEQKQIEHLRTFVRHEGKPIRLACQTRPLGDVVVRKTGVKKINEMFKRVAKS